MANHSTLPADQFRHKVLTRDQEQDLFIRRDDARERGDTAAELEIEAELVRHNMRAIVAVANRLSGYGLDMDDLIQIGVEGLLTAIRRYDRTRINPETGQPNKFSTMATHWIRQAVTRGVADTASTIRTPVHLYERKSRIDRTRAAFLRDHGRPATVAEVSQITGDTEAEILRVDQAARVVVSTDQRIRPDDPTSKTISEIVPAQLPGPDADADASDLRAIMLRAIGQLPEREAEIVRRRNGFDGHPETLDQIGQDLGVSRERVRQIERDAILRLRALVQGCQLGAYLGRESDPPPPDQLMLDLDPLPIHPLRQTAATLAAHLAEARAALAAA